MQEIFDPILAMLNYHPISAKIVESRPSQALIPLLVGNT